MHGRLVVVSGGAMGIGAGIAEAFLREGARVAILDREEPQSEVLATAPENQLLYIKTELTREAEIEAAVGVIRKNFGPLEVLVNNAGGNDAVGLRGSVDEFRQSLERNLVHYFALARCVLDDLIATRGTIINLGSKTALTGQGGTSGYAAAKGGILGLTREWAADLADRGVRVNAVVPAEVMTPLYERWLADSEDPEGARLRLNQTIPLEKRTTTIEEIASAVVFLASRKSAHTTGQWFFPDGGYVHMDRALTSGATHLKRS